MKSVLFLFLMIVPTGLLAESLYTDTWVNWTPAGKVFDVVCFSKKDGNKIMKDIRIMQFNRRAFQYKESAPDSELKAMSSKGCYFEQKDAHSVSRDEFFEEIISVKCNLNQLPFKDGDFRILGTNSITTSVKRLRDGKVWILPTNDCTFTTQLQKKPMVPAAPQQSSVPVVSEFNFPGQSDQPGSGQMSSPPVQEKPKVEKASEIPAPAKPVHAESAPAPVADKPIQTPTQPPAADPTANKGTIKAMINNME